ncbi:hypothetical protein F0P96_03915 [Hymenobacter busanensis]|uniref:Uncharacterized protein n=1 Tax=Hymenobacter busanensis TaxID=2607656 RepID=A0A7L4ZT04_9BACT|nr:hypothetical protein [Hymenobacter busanensis]KAA9339771.1 hypothetical protein F0P96_03915 [Hymenobacter busanensis]QHJ06474.1 hypothetical protein GUY19_03830 [Hymenobacter busanensis]
MKVVYTLLCCLALTAGSHAFASNGEEQPLKARATNMTRQMQRTAQLNEGQYLKVKQLTMDMLAAEENAKKLYAGEPDALNKRIAEVQEAYERDLAAILKPAQLVAYKQAQTNTIAVNGR